MTLHIHKSTNNDIPISYQYVHTHAVKAFEKILHINVRPEEVMLDGLNRTRFLRAHSAVAVAVEGVTEPLPMPAMSYPEYLHTLLWLKRLKEVSVCVCIYCGVCVCIVCVSCVFNISI